MVWLPLSTPLSDASCIVPASLCHNVLSRVWHVVTWVVGPQHHAVCSGKNIWESGFSSLIEEDGLCLLPRLFQCGILLMWKCSLSGEGVRWMDKNVKFQSLEHRSGTGTWPGILQALRFGWKNKWLINAIQARGMLAYLFVFFCFHWSVIDVQCCVPFCCTRQWISSKYIQSSLDSFPIYAIRECWVEFPVLCSIHSTLKCCPDGGGGRS